MCIGAIFVRLFTAAVIKRCKVETDTDLTWSQEVNQCPGFNVPSAAENHQGISEGIYRNDSYSEEELVKQLEDEFPWNLAWYEWVSDTSIFV